MLLMARYAMPYAMFSIIADIMRSARRKVMLLFTRFDIAAADWDGAAFAIAFSPPFSITFSFFWLLIFSFAADIVRKSEYIE